jgi:hypothetical protein
VTNNISYYSTELITSLSVLKYRPFGGNVKKALRENRQECLTIASLDNLVMFVAKAGDNPSEALFRFFSLDKAPVFT